MYHEYFSIVFVIIPKVHIELPLRDIFAIQFGRPLFSMIKRYRKPKIAIGMKTKKKESHSQCSLRNFVASSSPSSAAFLQSLHASFISLISLIFKSAMTLDLCLLLSIRNLYEDNPRVEILWCSYP